MSTSGNQQEWTSKTGQEIADDVNAILSGITYEYDVEEANTVNKVVSIKMPMLFGDKPNHIPLPGWVEMEFPKIKRIFLGVCGAYDKKRNINYGYFSASEIAHVYTDATFPWRNDTEWEMCFNDVDHWNPDYPTPSFLHEAAHTFSAHPLSTNPHEWTWKRDFSYLLLSYGYGHFEIDKIRYDTGGKDEVELEGVSRELAKLRFPTILRYVDGIGA